MIPKEQGLFFAEKFVDMTYTKEVQQLNMFLVGDPLMGLPTPI